MGTRGSQKKRNFGPALRGMMRKGETIHGARHMDIGKQNMDASGVKLENVYSGYAVFGFKHFEACVLQPGDNTRRTSSSSSVTRTRIWSDISLQLSKRNLNRRRSY
jgi:hypothetical protein